MIIKLIGLGLDRVIDWLVDGITLISLVDQCLVN